jgi:hypothetical protein
VASRRELVLGFTAKRIVVAGAGWASGASAKAKHVVEHTVNGSATSIHVRGTTVNAAQWLVRGLPAEVLSEFLAGRRPPKLPVERPARPARDDVLRASCPGASPEPRPAKRISRPHAPVVGSWQAAEEFAAWHMRSLGFADARVTNAGADGGIDVISSRAVGQVKHYETTAVGRPAIQQLRGAAHGIEWALFYTRSGYTAGAISYAGGVHVALFTYADDGTVHGANDMAAFLLQSRTRTVDPRVGEFAQFNQAQAQGQAALDDATNRYVAAVRRVMTGIPAARSRKQVAALSAIQREQPVVDQIIAYVGRTQLPLGEVLKQCKVIDGATRRISAIRL